MPDLLLAAVEYGGYISPVKFVIFLVLFFLWLPLVTWVYYDAKSLGTRDTFWTTIVFGAAAAAVIVWLLVPVFVVGMLFYLIAVGVAAVSYVMHRDNIVPEFQRILTLEHLKGVFVNDQKKLETLKSFIFITANNNEVPLPAPKTPDFFGYKSAYDLFTDALWRRASNVVFSPTPQNYNVIYYVDGAALKQPAMAKDQMEYLIHFLKNLADFDIDEKRKPQKGKFRIYKDKESIEWEIITAGSTAGEQVQLKRVSKSDIAKLADISLTPDQHEQLSGTKKVEQGLFIISGPKKSGVTTTFYALLRNHDPFLYSVSTLEKQPSAELLNITQNVFALSDTGTTTYAKKLQEVVRMGPNVVGVADCQDQKTAQVACRAAMDGKIVYVALEAENVVKAMGKWMQLVGDRNLATQTLQGITNQRLLRKLCEECKQAYEPNKENLRKFNIPADKAKVLHRAGKLKYDKRGKGRPCENCQETGFVGRISVFEIIMLNDQLREAIRQSKSLQEIKAQFRHVKMLYLQEQALKKVVDGTTSINEMLRIFSAPKKQGAAKPQQKK